MVFLSGGKPKFMKNSTCLLSPIKHEQPKFSSGLSGLNNHIHLIITIFYNQPFHIIMKLVDDFIVKKRIYVLIPEF